MAATREKIDAILADHSHHVFVGQAPERLIFCAGCDAVLSEVSATAGGASEKEADALLRDHQAGLIDQLLRGDLLNLARRDVLDAIVTNHTGLTAAVDVMVGANDISPEARDDIEEKAKGIIAAYLLAPLDDGHFDYDEDDPAYLATIDKVQSLLDRGNRDAWAILSVAQTELGRTASIQTTQTHLLRCSLRETADAVADRDRFRAALASAEEDRHPCTALHTRVDELRRRIGERHGFTLIGCSMCGDNMISQHSENTPANEEMETCSSCTAQLFTPAQT